MGVWVGGCLNTQGLKTLRNHLFLFRMPYGSHIHVPCITFTLARANYVLWFVQMRLWLFMVLAFTVCLHLYFLHQHFARLTIRKTSKYNRYVTCWSIYYKKRIVLLGTPHTTKVSIYIIIISVYGSSRGKHGVRDQILKAI